MKFEVCIPALTDKYVTIGFEIECRYHETDLIPNFFTDIETVSLAF